MHNTGKQYIRCIIYHNKTSVMHNLRSDFDKFFDLTKSVLKDRINSTGNLKFNSNKPKMDDYEIIALSLTSESLGIDSENYQWSKLKCDHTIDFPSLIDQCNHEMDKEVLAAVGKKDMAYVGVIGSKRKIDAIVKLFSEDQILTKEELERVDMPIGIKFNAITPAEIAISILAKLIDVKNNKTFC